MAKKFVEPIDMTQLEILNVRFQQLSSDPVTPVLGQFWLNTTAVRPRWFDGTLAQDIYPFAATNAPSTGVLRDSSGNFAAGTITASLTGTASNASQLNGQSAAFYLARANHTGTQTASTISDFATAVEAIPLNSLGLPVASVSINGQRLTNVANPVNPQDAATKAYVDSVAEGLSVRASVRLVTNGALPAYTRSGNIITANANGAISNIDGVTPVLNDRVLLKDGASGSDNGIYTVTAVGNSLAPWTLTRSSDADSSAEVPSGMFTFAEEGTIYANSGWVLATPNPIVLNTTALTFTQFSQSGTVTGANVGAGTGTIFRDKTGTSINFKSIVLASTRISLVNNANDITLDVVEANLVHNNIGGTLSATKGGTGLTATTARGVLIGAAGNTTAFTAAGSADQVFVVPSGGGAPVFGALNLAAAAATTGLLPIAAGGTGQATAINAFNALCPMTVLGDTLYGSTGGNALALAGNTSATRMFLNQTGNGTISAAPAWGTLVDGDIPSTLSANARVAILRGGTAVATRRGLNFIAGTNVTITAADNSGSERVDVTINATFTAVQKYATTLASSLTSYVVTHNLGTLDVTVAIYDTGTGEEVVADVIHATTNAVTINFAVAPTGGQYRVVVTG